MTTYSAASNPRHSIRPVLETRNPKPETLFLRSTRRARACVALCIALAGCAPSIHDVVHRRDFVLVRTMLEQEPSLANARNALGKTPLHNAVTYGVVDFVDFLLEHGSDVNAADNTGLTPLHVAALLGREKEAQRLIVHGANLDARDDFGDAPLHLAALHGQAPMIRLLAQAGADVACVNKRRLTPLESARENHQTDAVETLENSGELGRLGTVE